MKILNLGVRSKWKITKDDIKNASLDDLIFMQIPGGMILLKIRDILNRYENGEANNGNPSVDWVKNGKHQSYDGDSSIPAWMDNKNYAKERSLRDSFFESIKLSPKKYNMGSDFNVGDVLDHPKFGKGIVMMRGDTSVTVLFHDGNEKTLAINAK